MPELFLRYVPEDPEGDPWGVHLFGSGETVMPPGYTRYPIHPENHPAEYLFTWESGRVLREFGLMLISAGSGEFESGVAGRLRVRAGQVIFLHPGVWHRYRPDRRTGWTENWVHFGGDYSRVLMGQFFPPGRPVVRLERPGVVNDLLGDLHGLMRKGVFSTNRGVAIACFLAVVARIRQQDRQAGPGSGDGRHRIEKVCMSLLGNPGKADWNALARQAGMSVPHFRRKFREATGYAPHQYLARIRINRAQSLLRGTDTALAAIAGDLGYHDASHFSKAFRNATGKRPLDYRRGG